MSASTETPQEAATETKRKRGRPRKGKWPIPSSLRAEDTRRRQMHNRYDVALLALDLLRNLAIFSPKTVQRYMEPNSIGEVPTDVLKTIGKTVDPVWGENILKELQAIQDRLEKFTAEEMEKKKQAT